MALILLGKPNVGKSSLFNRLIRSRRSLVINQPGVTQDRVVGHWKLEDKAYEIWDLAGIPLESDLPMKEDWKSRVQAILFVVDGSTPLTGEDQEVFSKARTLQKPIILILNKRDKKSFEANHLDYYELSADAVISLSAETKDGLGELEDYVKTHFTSETSSSRPIRTLIFGRPNVGKSSLMNRLAGTHISKVEERAGTTRDLLSREIASQETRWELVDTAGVRKKASIYKREDLIEIFSAKKAIAELKRAEVVLLMVEATPTGQLHTQDRKLLRMVRDMRSPCLVLVNKWDQVRAKWRREESYRRALREELKEMGHLPILLISAKTGWGTKHIFPELKRILDRRKKISTPKLNKWLQSIFETRSPRIARAGSKEGKKKTQTQYLKFLYLTQESDRPMNFLMFCNAPRLVPPDEKRFLESKLREDFKLHGLSVLIKYRKKT